MGVCLYNDTCVWRDVLYIASIVLAHLDLIVQLRVFDIFTFYNRFF